MPIQHLAKFITPLSIVTMKGMAWLARFAAEIA
jgi:hypothetical protein